MTQFKAGDKVKRIKDSYAGMNVGDIGTIESVDYDTIVISEHKGLGSETRHDKDKFEIVTEEKQVFDIKSSKWFIRTPTPEISEIVQRWLFEQGFLWQVLGKDRIINTDKLYLVSSELCHNRFAWDDDLSSSKYKDYKEIKLTFKTIVSDVEYPETETQAQKDLKELEAQIAKLSEQAAKLKLSI